MAEEHKKRADTPLETRRYTARHCRAPVRCRHSRAAAEGQRQQQHGRQAGRAEQCVCRFRCVASQVLWEVSHAVRWHTLLTMHVFFLLCAGCSRQNCRGICHTCLGLFTRCLRRLLSSARSKPAWASRTEKTVKASLLGLVVAATPDIYGHLTYVDVMMGNCFYEHRY